MLYSLLYRSALFPNKIVDTVIIGTMDSSDFSGSLAELHYAYISLFKVDNHWNKKSPAARPAFSEFRDNPYITMPSL